VPEETQTNQPIEATQIAQSLSGEGSIEEKIGGLGTKRHESEHRFFSLPRLERRKLLQQRDPIVGDVPASTETTQFGFSCQRSDRSIDAAAASRVAG